MEKSGYQSSKIGNGPTHPVCGMFFPVQLFKRMIMSPKRNRKWSDKNRKNERDRRRKTRRKRERENFFLLSRPLFFRFLNHLRERNPETFPVTERNAFICLAASFWPIWGSLRCSLFWAAFFPAVPWRYFSCYIAILSLFGRLEARLRSEEEKL